MSVYTSTPPKNKKELEKQITLLCEILEENIEHAMTFESVDKQALTAAKFTLQTGFMWFHKGLKNQNEF